MIEKGSYHKLLSQSTRFARLLENIHQQKEEQAAANHLVPVLSRLSTRCSANSQHDDEDAIDIDNENAEKSQSGAVHASVYIGYLRAGLGFFSSVFLLLLIFGIREATFILYNHWLAKWSDDETNRFRTWKNCSQGVSERIEQIRSMNESDWKDYRSHRFHVFCGELMKVRVVFIYSANLGIALAIIIISFLRIILIRFLCLNSGRVLHNRYSVLFR